MTMTQQQARERAEQFAADFSAIRAEVGKAIVGHGEIVEGVLMCLFCGGHALLEGVPGIGKTLLIRTLSQAVQLSFSRVQFTPDLMPADITGTSIVIEKDRPDGSRAREFAFQAGPLFAQMVLADEINRATPKTQSALLEAMAERSVTVGGTTHPLPRPFFVMATQNPLEQEGTYPLPEAQLDRFFFKLLVGYSGRAELTEILRRTTTDHAVTINKVVDATRLLEHQQLVREVAIAEHVSDLAVRIVLATQPAMEGGGSGGAGGVVAGDAGKYATPLVSRFVRVGASPRAAQAIVLAAKCRALMQGRFNVSAEDVRGVALAALRHRLILNFEAAAEGVSTDSIVRNLIETVPGEG
jgi:MoxR-like ATPase